MAFGMSNPHEADCLQHILNQSAFTSPASIYLALLTGDPGETGVPSNEPAGSSRTLLNFNPASNGEALNGAISPIDTTGWTDTSPLTHGALSVSLSGGLFNWYGPLTQTISFTAGDQLTIAAGDIKVRFYDYSGGVPDPPGSEITVTGANKWLDHSLGTSSWGSLSNPVVSLHTAAPASAGNEFTGGGYARQSWGPTTQGSSGDFTTYTHTLQLTFSNIQSTPLRAWGLWQGLDLVFIRDQGSDSPVTPGSSIEAPGSTLVLGVD